MTGMKDFWKVKKDVHDDPESSQTKQTDKSITSVKCGAQ
jgi:hypothetical protein